MSNIFWSRGTPVAPGPFWKGFLFNLRTAEFYEIRPADIGYTLLYRPVPGYHGELISHDTSIVKAKKAAEDHWREKVVPVLLAALQPRVGRDEPFTLKPMESE
jgi:hypothetical protein